MKLKDWLDRWREGNIGWHQNEGNKGLQQYWPKLPNSSRVLVPLCGKTVDMAWLNRKGMDVTGVEISATAAKTFDGVDTIACMAATLTQRLDVVDLPEEDWDNTLRVNLTGSFLVCKHGIPLLRKAGGGSIILTASQMGQVAWPGSTAYCTTKGGILQLVKGIALDHKDENIRCNSISPGGVATGRLLARWGDMETAEKEWGPKHALGRLGRPSEIAAGAVFLASDESSFMTGADLLLDGGYTAW